MQTTIESGDRLVDRRTHPDRRRHAFRTLTYCGLAQRGRRRETRRTGDNYYLDWYDPRLVFAGLGILLLSTTDAALTLILMGLGATELNTIMDHLMNISIPLFVAAKIAITAGGVLFLLTHAHFHILKLTTGRRVIHALLGVYALLIAYELFLLARYAQ